MEDGKEMGGMDMKINNGKMELDMKATILSFSVKIFPDFQVQFFWQMIINIK